MSNRFWFIISILNLKILPLFFFLNIQSINSAILSQKPITVREQFWYIFREITYNITQETIQNSFQNQDIKKLRNQLTWLTFLVKHIFLPNSSKRFYQRTCMRINALKKQLSDIEEKKNIKNTFSALLN